MDVMQITLGTILLVAAGLITVGQSVAGSTPALHAIAILGVCLTVCAAIIGAIRNQQSQSI